jgi:hypothetical protein
VQFDLTEGRVSAGAASLYARNTEPADFGDKILDLLADPARRAEMGAFGRRRVREELAWTYEEPKLLAAYAQLFAGEDVPRAAWSEACSPARPGRSLPRGTDGQG